MSDKKTVTTIRGEEVPRDQCRRITGAFYKIGDPKVKGSGDCYKIGDRFYRDDTDYIVFDEFSQEYVIKNETVIEGIIGVEEGKFVKGYFSKNPIYNSSFKENRYATGVPVLSKETLEPYREYRYYRADDCFLPKRALIATEFSKLPYLDMDEKYNLPYNCDEAIMTSFKNSFNKSEFKINPMTAEIAKALDGLSFGLEFETTRGKVPSRLTSALGLIPLRDGSISGLEYATIPYTGEKGIAATKFVCEALENFTEYDEHCSLHLHVGGIPRTKGYLTALFKVLCIIQDEMYSLFPLYKKYNFGVKRKNYTKPLPASEILSKLDTKIDSSNIDTNFNTVFQFLSMGISMDNYSNDLSLVKSHPSDPRGSSKWNIRSRYHWVNLIPIVFGNKATVEFRIHTPTTDYNKVISYMLMCGGILKYVQTNMKDILSGSPMTTLNDILYTTYREFPQLITRLSRYKDIRRNTTYEQNSQGNIRGNELEISSVDLFKEKKSIFDSVSEMPVWMGVSDTSNRVVRTRRSAW